MLERLLRFFRLRPQQPSQEFMVSLVRDRADAKLVLCRAIAKANLILGETGGPSVGMEIVPLAEDLLMKLDRIEARLRVSRAGGR